MVDPKRVPKGRGHPAYHQFAALDGELDHDVRMFECVIMGVPFQNDPDTAVTQKVYVCARDRDEAKVMLLAACAVEDIIVERAWIAPVGKAVIFAKRQKSFLPGAIPAINAQFAPVYRRTTD